MQKKTMLVFGVGINDADYVVQPTINGKRGVCPFYRAWKNMLTRCHDPKYQAANPTYIGCSVVPEWHVFMTFRAWMLERDWRGMQLDKDLLFPGNKVYGPEACAFISRELNSFTTDSAATRGEFPIGVCWHKQIGKFQARCRNPFTDKQEHLGYFTCQDAAHEAWRSRKRELSLQLAAEQSDPRLAAALATRYLEKSQ
jgi:hypothetical protein